MGATGGVVDVMGATGGAVDVMGVTGGAVDVMGGTGGAVDVMGGTGGVVDVTGGTGGVVDVTGGTGGVVGSRCLLGNGDGPAEYRCVRRLRRKRLLALLSRQGFDRAYDALMEDTDGEFFCRGELKQLVRAGEWDDAIAYLSRFLPKFPNPKSAEAHVLLKFLRIHSVFASVVAGNMDHPTTKLYAGKYKHYLSHDTTLTFGGLRIRSIILSILYSHSVRASLNWDWVRQSAADIIAWFVNTVPELKRHGIYIRPNVTPHTVLPIGFGFRQRRHVKRRGRQPRASAVVRVFRSKQTRLFFPINSDEPTMGFPPKALDQLADILDKSLLAGQRTEIYLEALTYPLKSFGNKDAPGTLFSQTMLGSLADPAKNSRISSVTSAGTPGALPSQIMLGSLTGRAENCGTSSLTNAEYLGQAQTSVQGKS